MKHALRLRALAHRRHGGSQSKQVTIDAKASDLPFRDAGNHRLMPKRFACMDVRHVYFDDGHGQDRQGVSQAVAVVRPRAGIDEDGGKVLAEGLMDALAHGAFMVALKRDHMCSELTGEFPEFRIDFSQRDGAVLSGFTFAEHVEIDAMKYKDIHELLRLDLT